MEEGGRVFNFPEGGEIFRFVSERFDILGGGVRMVACMRQ